MANAVVHFEIIGPDPDRLRTFYSALFGWDAPAGAPVAAAISAPDSHTFLEPADDGEPPAGGIGGGAGFTAHTVVYVGVDDVTATLALVEELGGAVVLEPQRNAEGMVTVGHFRDPAGNLIGGRRPALSRGGAAG